VPLLGGSILLMRMFTGDLLPTVQVPLICRIPLVGLISDDPGTGMQLYWKADDQSGRDVSNSGHWNRTRFENPV
jgi:hypothetical protein